jgi:hypothetical protein
MNLRNSDSKKHDLSQATAFVIHFQPTMMYTYIYMYVIYIYIFEWPMMVRRFGYLASMQSLFCPSAIPQQP